MPMNPQGLADFIFLNANVTHLTYASWGPDRNLISVGNVWISRSMLAISSPQSTC